jgi:ParB family chromosome partitioning protein
MTVRTRTRPTACAPRRVQIIEGDPEAVKALTITARTDPGQFAHVAQRLRDKRAAAAARAAAVAELTGAGVRVVEEPGYGERTVAKLDHLRTASAEGECELTAEKHASCPGHAAYLRDRGAWGGTPEITPVFVCTDWRGQGHQQRFRSPMTGLDTSQGASGGDGGMSEQAKAERRLVIANNKAWDSARPVRHEWLTRFLARRTPPKDAPQWIAATLASCAPDVRRAMDDGHQTALNLLGLAGDQPWRHYDGRPHPLVDAAAKTTSARATMLTLAMLLGGLESTVTRSTWRYATAAQRAHFTALQRWGYPLSDVEQLVLQLTAEPGAEPAEAGDDTDAVDATGAVDATEATDAAAGGPKSAGTESA